MPVESASLPLPVADPSRFRERLNDAATIAGRFAHDFDNLLMGIMGFTELALAQTTAGSPAHKYLVELYQVAERGKSMTQEMHDLSRSGRQIAVPTPLPKVWRAIRAEAENAAGPKISIACEFSEDLPAIAIGTDPFSLVLRHVLNNAVEAIGGAGKIIVTARSASLTAVDDAWLPRPLVPGTYVEVTMSDSGAGMRPEKLAQVSVAPFVTTKARHLGLGLAIVYRILEAHGGGVRFGAAQPQGTQVTLMLPAASPSSFGTAGGGQFGHTITRGMAR